MPINVTPMKLENLYRCERYSDNTAGVLTECIPVAIAENGQAVQDPVRQVVYLGETKLVTSGGVQDLGFLIPAESLEEAVVNFAAACAGKIDEIESARIQQRMLAGVGAKPGLITGPGKLK